MNVVKAYPPNIDKVMKAFPINKNTVFTYGDTIYAPGVEFSLPNDLVVHEETHMRQQGDNPEAWWDKYISDVQFRYSQEVEAYRNQYRAYCKVVKDRNRRFSFLVTIARDLSGPLYGRIIDFYQATQMIKS